MRKLDYRPRGVCPSLIRLEVDDDDRIVSVEFIGGCDGNSKGIGALVRGMSLEDARRRLSGIRCGAKPTSCPDQLARALEALGKGGD